ncbi:hypothetical protein M426DRAFT_323922 [Hypoxylon sp. CI-4A]|nr:hypothetical protein M426DRAFT_323922 [Hypoxylon sp. CI-4A]
MAEPDLRRYRDRGLGGDETARHSRDKRTRGEGDGNEVKHSRRGYDDGGGGGERYGREHREKRRSLSPRDGAHREIQRDIEYRRSGRDDYTQQSDSMTRKQRRPLDERSPSPSSARHTRRHHHRSRRDDHHHRHNHPPSHSTPALAPAELPFDSRPLVRSDLDAFKPLLAHYLDVQKGKDITTMDEREVKGRWKSFIGKWNHGDLAEGWYQPETLVDARENWAGVSHREPAPDEDGDNERNTTTTTLTTTATAIATGTSPSPPHNRPNQEESNDPSNTKDEDEDEDEEFGPTLPPSATSQTQPTSVVVVSRHGPGIPTLQDLSLRREAAAESHQQSVADLRLARKLDRTTQRERLDELAPRAEPGSRERQLEKKRAVNDKMRGFRERSPGGAGGAEVGEAELMGGGGGDDGDDGLAEYKRMKGLAERRKTDREVRREEESRARAAEREERVREYRIREEGVLEGLRRIAKERFG